MAMFISPEKIYKDDVALVLEVRRLKRLSCHDRMPCLCLVFLCLVRRKLTLSLPLFPSLYAHARIRTTWTPTSRPSATTAALTS
jgi:hypothetical protein